MLCPINSHSVELVMILNIFSHNVIIEISIVDGNRKTFFQILTPGTEWVGVANIIYK